MGKKKSLAITAAVLLVLIFADQVTKQLAAAYLYEKEPIELIPGVFELHFLINRGAAFGIMQNQQYFFTITTCIMLCLFVYIYIRIPEKGRYQPLRALLVLLMAGAIGNLLDRVRQGYVIDFFYFKWIDFPIFNVADCYVVIAVVLLALLILFYYKEEELEELFAHIFPGRRKKV